jgi:hypothetical protein
MRCPQTCGNARPQRAGRVLKPTDRRGARYALQPFAAALTDCPTEPPRACTSGDGSPEDGESHVARVDRQNPAREQSRCAVQLLSASLTRTRAGKCRMSAETARRNSPGLLSQPPNGNLRRYSSTNRAG